MLCHSSIHFYCMQIANFWAHLPSITHMTYFLCKQLKMVKTPQLHSQQIKQYKYNAFPQFGIAKYAALPLLLKNILSVGPVLQPVLSRLKILVSSASKKKKQFFEIQFLPFQKIISSFQLMNFSLLLLPELLVFSFETALTFFFRKQYTNLFLVYCHFQLASLFIHMFLVPQLGVLPPLITLLASTSQNGQTYSNNLLPKTNELYLNIVWSWYLKVKNRF